MRVQITSAIAGRPAYALGEIVELEDRIARAWITDGLAVPARDHATETTEMAMAGTEAAVTHGRRRR